MLEGGTVTLPAGHTAIGMNTAAVWPYYLLSFSTPTMIAGVEILAGVSGKSIQHKKLLRAQRAAERTLNGSIRV